MANPRRVPVPITRLRFEECFYVSKRSSLRYTFYGYNSSLHVYVAYDGRELFHFSPRTVVWIEDTLLPY